MLEVGWKLARGERIDARQDGTIPRGLRENYFTEAIGAELSTPLNIDADILKAQRTDNPRAYELFVRGLALLERLDIGCAFWPDGVNPRNVPQLARGAGIELAEVGTGGNGLL